MGSMSSRFLKAQLKIPWSGMVLFVKIGPPPPRFPRSKSNWKLEYKKLPLYDKMFRTASTTPLVFTLLVLPTSVYSYFTHFSLQFVKMVLNHNFELFSFSAAKEL